MRIAVTGAGGGLGRAFLERVPDRHEVHAFTHKNLPVEDLHAVMQRVVPVRPEVIMNFAAFTAVDDCEIDPGRAFAANALGARHLALAARACDAVLVHVSTDYVFDGTKGQPYHEFDRPNPLSAYGKSKLAGEREAALAPEHLVVRTSWLFGAEGDRVARWLGRLAAGEAVGAIVDRTGSPTHVGHLAERLLPLVHSGQRGVVHLAGPEPASWHDLLLRLVRLGDLPGEVAEQKEGDLGRPAPRPANSALTSVVLPRTGVPPMPSLDQAIGEVLGGRA